MTKKNNIKLACILNIAPIYRNGIYKLIIESFDCHFFFGEKAAYGSSIKTIPMKFFDGRATLIENRSFICPPLWWQPGVIRQFFHSYNRFLITGDFYSISTWIILFLSIFFPSKKIITWTHGWYGRESKVKIFIKKIFFSMCDAVLVYGNHAKRLMCENGLDCKKIHAVHNSLNFEEHKKILTTLQHTDIMFEHFKNHDPVIIFIGRLIADKKIGYLLDAASLLKKENCNINLLIIGDGPEKSSLQKKAEENGLSVWFYGPCYDENINAQLIFDSQLCVIPGDAGLTIIHSMTFGCPVITHDNISKHGPEFEAIQENVSGAFYKENDIADLAKKIKLWCFQKTISEADKKTCMDIIRREWTPEFQIKVIEKALNEITANQFCRE